MATKKRRKAQTIKPHKAARISCRWCGIPHGLKQHAGHKFGQYLKKAAAQVKERGVDVRRQAGMPTGREVYDWFLKETVSDRLQDIVDAHQVEGITEAVGKTKVDEEGNVIGRHGGRFSNLFPELKAIDRGPAAIVRSIQSGRKTPLQVNIRGAVADWVEFHHRDDLLTFLDEHPREAIEEFLKSRAA